MSSFLRADTTRFQSPGDPSSAWEGPRCFFRSFLSSRDPNRTSERLSHTRLKATRVARGNDISRLLTGDVFRFVVITASYIYCNIIITTTEHSYTYTYAVNYRCFLISAQFLRSSSVRGGPRPMTRGREDNSVYIIECAVAWLLYTAYTLASVFFVT